VFRGDRNRVGEFAQRRRVGLEPIDLVECKNGRFVPSIDLMQHDFNGFDLLLRLRVAHIHNMQQQIGFNSLFERGFK